MSIEDKFMEIINITEKLSWDTELNMTATEIIRKIASPFGLTSRDISIIFKFMTNQLLLDYFKERKMMHAYQILIESDPAKKSPGIIDKAVAISGFDNQSSFSKKFHDVFRMTPKEALKKKDRSLLKAPITWGQVINLNYEDIVNSEVIEMSNNKIFGVDAEQVEYLRQVFDLQGIYGIPDYVCDAACTFSKEHDVPLEKTFEYFKEMYVPMEEWEEIKESSEITYSNEEEYFNQKILPEIKDEFLIRLVFFSVLSLNEAIDVYYRLTYYFGNKIPEVSKTALILLTSNQLEINYCIKAGKYFDEHETEDYGREKAEKYMEYLIMNFPIETAYMEAGFCLYEKDFDEMDFYDVIDPFGDYDSLVAIPYAYENDEEDYNPSWKDDIDDLMYGDSGDDFGSDDYSEDSFA